MALAQGPTAPIAAAKAGHPRQRWPALVAAVLTFGTGALDVATLTHLGGVFASVMTGNFALTGLALSRSDGALLTHTTVGLAGYVIGVAVGSRITGARGSTAPLWPRSVTVTLAVQLGVLIGLAVGWELTGGAPSGIAQLALLSAAAAAMGLQGAAMRGLGVTVTTTYLTGTLTGVIAALTGSSRTRTDRAAIAALTAAVGGAAGAGLVLATAPAALPLLVLIPVAAVLTAAGHRRLVVSGRRTKRAPLPSHPLSRGTRCAALVRSAVEAG